jgi:hypothetical protein
VILERARGLTQEIRDLADRGRRLDRAEALGTRRIELDPLLQRLRPIVATFRVLTEHGVTVSVPERALRTAGERVRQLRESLSAPSDSPLGNSRFVPVVAQVERAADELNAAVVAAWRAHVDSRRPRVDRHVLDVLRGLEGFETDARGIESRLTAIDAALSTLPRTTQDITALEKNIAEIDRIWRNLEGDNVPVDVLAFLRDAGTRGAMIDQLTENVREWLRAHHLWDRVRVQLTREPMPRTVAQ